MKEQIHEPGCVCKVCFFREFAGCEIVGRRIEESRRRQKAKGTEEGRKTMPMQITLDQLERWLDGQIAFGIKLHQDTPFIERFLADAKRREPDASIDPAIVSLGRYPRHNAIALKLAIDTVKAQLVDRDRPRRTWERRN